MKNYILPIPFALGPYGIHTQSVHERIWNLSGANESAGDINPSNLLKANSHLLEPVKFELLEDNKPEIGRFLASALSMVENTTNAINKIWPELARLVVIGGDHSVAIGTGAALSKVTDLGRVGMVWIDSHGDIHTDKTSLTKSITGYPLAINAGYGAGELTSCYNGNFLKQITHVGVRDIDPTEYSVFEQIPMQVISALDLEYMNMKQVADKILDQFKDMEYIWISLDIDVLDHVFFMPGETDLPVPGGMTPREVLALVNILSKDPRAKILEIVQLNDVGQSTPLIVFCSRLIEIFFGVGGFRYLS